MKCRFFRVDFKSLSVMGIKTGMTWKEADLKKKKQKKKKQLLKEAVGDRDRSPGGWKSQYAPTADLAKFIVWRILVVTTKACSSAVSKVWIRRYLKWNYESQEQYSYSCFYFIFFPFFLQQCICDQICQ